MSQTSEGRSESLSAVDPVARLRIALDRMAFALEHRKERPEPVQEPVVVAGPDTSAMIAGLDELIQEVQAVLADIGPIAVSSKDEAPEHEQQGIESIPTNDEES
ncbi:hypothetical protein [Acetobacter sp.]|uniref:hypothetical protein n=1 Tax=Acetobacter sp. TaxID=440 RepID=UPI0039E99D61